MAAVANFAVPAGGASAVEPLPPITGKITGTVFEGDGVTPVPAATVEFLSNQILFHRVRYVTANSSGVFTFTGAPLLPVPAYSYYLRGIHPQVSSTVTDGVAGGFEPGQTIDAQDIVFAGTGRVRGYVRRHTGAAVTTGSVSVTRFATTYATVPLGADGAYAVGGMPASAYEYTVAASLPAHPQGTGLSAFAQMATITAGQTSDVNLTVEPTGRLEGTLLDAAGTRSSGSSSPGTDRQPHRSRSSDPPPRRRVDDSPPKTCRWGRTR